MSSPEVRELLDRQAIADVLATFCARLDEYAIGAAVETFTIDCATDYGPSTMTGGGPLHGRDALRERLLRSQSSWRRTHHQLGQILIRFDADGASALASSTAYAERWDGSVDRLWNRYLDRLVEVDGRWLIASRRMEAAGIAGFDGLDWNWVARAQRDEARVPTP